MDVPEPIYQWTSPILSLGYKQIGDTEAIAIAKALAKNTSVNTFPSLITKLGTLEL